MVNLVIHVQHYWNLRLGEEENFVMVERVILEVQQSNLIEKIAPQELLILSHLPPRSSL